MKIAYLFLLHEKPDMAARAIEKLRSPDTAIFIHVDAKKNIEEFKYAISGNVVFLDKRIKVNHGGFSQIRSMLNILEFAAGHGDYDAYQFMSGRDYPLHGVEKILEFHAARPDTDFMNYYELSDGASFSFNLYNYHFVDFLAMLPKRAGHYVTRFKQILNRYAPNRKFLAGYTAYRGSNWVCLSRDTAHKILAFLKTGKGRRFYNRFRLTWGGDEIFFQTLVKNIGTNKIADRSHYADWTAEREHPSVLDERDWDNLKQTSCRYARKFDSEKSARLIDLIDSREDRADFDFDAAPFSGKWIT